MIPFQGKEAGGTFVVVVSRSRFLTGPHSQSVTPFVPRPLISLRELKGFVKWAVFGERTLIPWTSQDGPPQTECMTPPPPDRNPTRNGRVSPWPSCPWSPYWSGSEFTHPSS